MLREVLSVEIYTILLVICLIVVAITKLLFPKRFHDFSFLLISFKYLKIYVRQRKFFDVFEILLFTNLIVGILIFTSLYFNLSINLTQTNYLLPPNLAIGISALILIKIVLEHVISNIFKKNDIINNYIFLKVSYKNFLGLLLIPINIILIYSWHASQINMVIFLLLLVLINFFGIVFFIKDNLKIIKKNWFYFILYLCALEISPYYVLYKLYTQ